MSQLLKRKAAMDAALAHFQERPLDWGRFDCAKLALFLARQMGHRVNIAKFGQYKTPAGARAALTRRGFKDLPDLIDSLGCERIAPAAALPADIIGFLPQPDPENPLPCDDMTALCGYVGNGRVLGFHAATGVCLVMQPDYAKAKLAPVAWRL